MNLSTNGCLRPVAFLLFERVNGENDLWRHLSFAHMCVRNHFIVIVCGFTHCYTVIEGTTICLDFHYWS